MKDHDEKPFVVPSSLPSKCTYKPGDTIQKTPHSHKPRNKERPAKIARNILECIGETPLVQLNTLPKEMGIKCDILVKCEYMNPGGSVKDRIGLRMIEDAEKAGKLKPGSTLIEPTSGNTGIAVALAAAVKGYRCIIVMPQKMSMEKVNTLTALGAEIIRTPNGKSFDDPESNLRVAQRLLTEIPNSYMLDQFRNASNPLAHYDGTAEEILEACGGRVDMVVAGAGTGGSLTGLGRKIKERCPDCKVIGVDPFGSQMARPHSLNKTDVKSYEVEGVGFDFIPTACDLNIIDKWYKVGDKDVFTTARKLIREEGLLCGGSSGANTFVALQAAREFCLGPKKKVVVVLPDSIRNYMTKFLLDDWMRDRGFVEPENVSEIERPWWWEMSICSVKLRPPLTVHPGVSINNTLTLMQRENYDQVPIVNKVGHVEGMVTTQCMMTQLRAGKIQVTDPVSTVLSNNFKTVPIDTTLGEVSTMLETHQYVLVVHEQRQYGEGDTEEVKRIIFGIVTRIDLLNFIAKTEETERNSKRRSALKPLQSANVGFTGIGTVGGRHDMKRASIKGGRVHGNKDTVMGGTITGTDLLNQNGNSNDVGQYNGNRDGGQNGTTFVTENRNGLPNGVPIGYSQTGTKNGVHNRPLFTKEKGGHITMANTSQNGNHNTQYLPHINGNGSLVSSSSNVGLCPYDSKTSSVNNPKPSFSDHPVNKRDTPANVSYRL